MNVVKFKPEDYVKSSCSTEFYKAVGLFDIIKVGAVTNVHQMRLRQDKAQAMISFDWMNYSPVQDETVPENEIWWGDCK